MFDSIIFQVVIQRFRQSFIVVFQIFCNQGHIKNHLIESTHEIAIKKLLLKQGFRKEFTNELKKFDIQSLDGRFGVREVGRSLGSFTEKGHIFLEHLLGKQCVPLFGEASLIYTPFIFELNPES